jgi:hypothetical protein
MVDRSALAHKEPADRKHESPASLAVRKIELGRNAVVWQPILAAGGFSTRPAALAIHRMQPAGQVGRLQPSPEGTPGFSPTFFGFIYIHAAVGGTEAREIRRVSNTAA